ncbi:MAG TPA: carboxylesterase family protein [Povalibacter sp.]|uniref:carboxylesterase/lipase family protein n=1 Tax=Povalibacter sp. TaxID=1962978 RepID=UPI002CFC4385|nr:carboxylesterase family protein [Povalibacter sp.]HMN45581.1 carboxylesterase family protein [Povalibacter sp.]
MHCRHPIAFAIVALMLHGCSKQPAPEPVAADPLVRKIDAGELRGVEQPNGSRAWLGIPYAKPPVGERRWQAPQPIDPWQGVFAADRDEHVCPQFVSPLTQGVADSDGDGIVGDEDCLYLSVYAPANATKPLPVMFWIFGGGNNSGYAADYNGSTLAQTHDVVVVTVNYRLGSLGWFRHPALLANVAEGPARSGNWADLDQQLALQWVQKNIATFGGDPNNVTIFGESAGGFNVLSLMISPQAKGLFHKAIVESGGLRTMSVASAVNYSDDAEPGTAFSSREIVNKILVRDGKATDRAAAKKLQTTMTDAQIAELLHAQSVAGFLKLYNPEGARNYPSTQKIADGTVYPTRPVIELFASGDYNRVPVILGTNRDERRIYMYRLPRWQEVLKKSPDDYVKFANYPSLQWKYTGVDSLARAMSPIEPAVFAYRFDWDEGGKLGDIDLSVAVGAAHSTEIAFVFGDWNIGFLPPDAMYPPERHAARDALSKSMMSYWAQFAYAGSPGKGRDGNEVEWSAWKNAAGEPKTLILDTQEGGGIRMMNEEVTATSVKERMLADRFADQRLHCEAYALAFSTNAQFDPKEYATLGAKGCRQYPPASFKPSF